MALVDLTLRDFRNLASVQIEPLPVGFNLLHGPNGSGKTSILEAIYYLGLGRSFRSALASRIIRHSAAGFLIFSHINTQQEQNVPIGIERPLQGEMKIRIAGKDVRTAAHLADLVPIQLINSHCYNLLESGPAFRRKYLDWGVFYANKEFLRIWREYSQVLKQRNQLLRQRGSIKELNAWTQELIHRAEPFNAFRQAYIEKLLPLLKEMVRDLMPDAGIHSDLMCRYQSGWDSSQNYPEILQNSLEKDMQLGYTQWGPHRADLKITINKIPAKDILSRGQQKLFVCAMILAQGALLARLSNTKVIYLVDDLPSELDATSKSNLISLLSKQETQIFVTAVEKEAFTTEVPLKMFHVKHGSVNE